MGKVRTGLAVSLDGFISGPNDSAEVPMGVGGERLLAWYAAGDTDYQLPGTDMVYGLLELRSWSNAINTRSR
jgi:hypothetical protein